MCNYMPHLFCNANNTPYETGNQWLNFFPLTTGHACTWVQLSSVHIGCICQSVGISFVSPARVHHGEGEAREAGAVFGVCFFMYLLSLLIESCGFVCSAGPCLLWHSEKWHVHTGCNLAWHTWFHSGLQAKAKTYFSWGKKQLVVLQMSFFSLSQRGLHFCLVLPKLVLLKFNVFY